MVKNRRPRGRFTRTRIEALEPRRLLTSLAFAQDDAHLHREEGFAAHGAAGGLHGMYQLKPGQSAPPEARFVDSGSHWPQAGGPGTPLTIAYSYSNLLDGKLGGGLSPAVLRAAVEEAFAVWASVTPLNFVEVSDSGPQPTAADENYDPTGHPQIRLGHHSIDGDSFTLAHASFPDFGGQGGDIHFDTDEDWSTHPFGGVDIIEVTVHELGHALGLAHEDDVAAIMNAAYGGRFAGPGSAFLFSDDADGVTSIYGNGTGSVTPATPVDAGDDIYSVHEDGRLSASSDTLISLGAIWSYQDNGANLGSAWRSEQFNDSPWPTGAAPLGYGDGDEATTVGFGANASNKFVTTYFRHRFNVTSLDTYTRLLLTVFRDDGVAIYLNGTEIGRDNLPAGASFSTLASSTANDDGNSGQTFNIEVDALPAGTLRQGDNVLAVEIHQAGRDSSDISFDLSLVAVEDNPSVLANDRSDDGRSLTAVLHEPPANGAVNLQPDGSFVYRPAADFHGQDTFYYRASNGENLSNVAAVTIDVRPVEDPPRGVDDGYFAREDAPLVVAAHPASVERWIETESTWRYLDDGSDQGSAWRDADFADESWNVGDGQFGYGDGDELTLIDFGGTDNQKHVTTYFRHAFDVRDVSDVSRLRLLLLRDDGAAIYLNGVEIVRDNLSNGATYDTLARSTASGNEEDVLHEFYVDVGGLPLDTLINGRNVLAVEVHQANRNSSDLSFDLELNAIRGGTGLLSNDVDPDGDPIIAYLERDATNGNVVILPDGSFRYEPKPDYAGPDSFSYRLSSGEGNALLPYGSSWSYLDNGSNPGPVWMDPTYDDATWRNAAAELGYGEGDEATTVRFLTTDADNKFATTYFRSNLNVTNVGDVTGVSAQLLRDDAAAVYLNGVEVFRDNELSDNAAFNQFASDSNGENAVASFSMTPALLREGNNVLAVEVHQDSPTSSDISFDLELNLQRNGDPPATVFAFTSVWSYLDDGSNQGTAWRFLDYDDSLWARGRGPFGYGDDDEATIVRGSGDPNFKFATTFFRTQFELPDLNLYPGFSVQLVRDDAAAVYVNGHEIFRDDTLRSSAAFNEFTGVSIVDNEAEPVTFGLAHQYLTEGDNWIAVEVHQATPDSSDLSFDLQLNGLTVNGPEIEVSLDVLPSSDTPITTDDAYEAFAETPLNIERPEGVRANDDEKDNPSPTLVLQSGPSHGSLNLHDDGSFQYQPETGFVGTDQFSYVLDAQTEVSLIRPGSHWRLLDDGSDPGLSWSSLAFDDSAWSTGSGQFGYGDDDEATAVSFGNDPSNKLATTHFRHKFTLASPAQVQSLAASIVRDDAAAVFLNGVEVYRDGNLSPGATFDAFASSSINDSIGRRFLDFAIDPSVLQIGDNVVAVEVHQASASSSDLSFDFKLIAALVSNVATATVTIAPTDTAPVVEQVAINTDVPDPADLPQGPQLTSWATQRSDIRSITVTFSEAVLIRQEDVRLVNLGVDAPNEPDAPITLRSESLLVDQNMLTLSFSAQELPEGVYALELLPTITSATGVPLDGNLDGQSGDAFRFIGDTHNRFYALRAEFNGDGGVSIFDFPVFAYWFGMPLGIAPAYADLNQDGGVSIFDFPWFANNFGTGVAFPSAAAAVRLESKPSHVEPTYPPIIRDDQLGVPDSRLHDLALLDWLQQRRVQKRSWLTSQPVD